MSDAPPPADDTEALLGAAHDFPAGPAPKLVYMVADSPQCDGNLLCRHLWRTGVLGAPMSYFGPDREVFMLATRLKANNFFDLFNMVLQRRSSPNGVFGFRARREDFRLLDIAGLTGRVRQMRMIFIDRRDDVTQAVAAARAPNGVLAGGPYGFEPIAETLQALRATREAWRENFQQIGARPIIVDHAMLLADPARAVALVANAFGVTLAPDKTIDVPLIARAADPEAEAWTARFKSEAALRGVAIGPPGQSPQPTAAVPGGTP